MIKKILKKLARTFFEMVLLFFPLLGLFVSFSIKKNNCHWSNWHKWKIYGG